MQADDGWIPNARRSTERDDDATPVTDLAAPPPPSSLPTVNAWWSDDPAERFWMEITTRPDVGSNVRAPQLDGGGHEYWSYSLVTALQPGDVVLHWHKDLGGEPGIVGYSTAADGPFDDELDWNARGTYGRRRASAGAQPAWRYELIAYTALSEPIGQSVFRQAEDRLRRIKSDLQAVHPGPLYFPFAFYENRPMRAMQAYIVKFPARILSVIPELSALSLRPRAAVAQRTPMRSGARPRSSGAGYIADPVLRRAIEQYAVRQAGALYPGWQIRDVGTTESYDLHATKGSEEVHIEVKGSTMRVGRIELTVNEVTHARSEVRTDLVVVDQIEWDRQPDGSIRPHGGRRRHWTGWRPADEALSPTRFRYRLPEA